MKIYKEFHTENLPMLSKETDKCKIFDWKKIITEQIPIHFVYGEIEGDIYVISENRENKTVTIKINGYTDGYIINRHDLIRGRIASALNLYSKDYKYNVGDVVKTPYGEVIIKEQKRIFSQTYIQQGGHSYYVKGYTIYCEKHKCIRDVKENQLKIGVGCPLCSGSKLMVINGSNDFATTHPELVKYLVNKEDAKMYSKGSNKVLDMQCPDCGFKTKYTLRALTTYKFPCACSENMNYPNRLMMNILLQIGAEFYSEVTFKTLDWIPKYLRYDFYVKTDKQDFLIEMDGHQHYNTISSYGDKNLEWRKKFDDLKNQLARDNGVFLIRINCNYYSLETRHNYIVKNILNSPLFTSLDFSKVNFEEAERKSLPSVVLKIAEDYKNGETNIKKLSEKYNLNESTIHKYLVIATAAELCNYDINLKKYVV